MIETILWSIWILGMPISYIYARKEWKREFREWTVNNRAVHLALSIGASWVFMFAVWVMSDSNNTEAKW